MGGEGGGDDGFIPERQVFWGRVYLELFATCWNANVRIQISEIRNPGVCSSNGQGPT